MRNLIVVCALLALSSATLAQSSAAPAVKKSDQGICHERGSATYKRTKYFEPYDTMDACLASGGRLAKNTSSDSDDAPAGSGPSWLTGIGKKVAVIIGMLVIVGGAFLLSRRRSR